MAARTCFEFCLHIHKTPGKDECPDLFTIGLQDGMLLRGICHVQPIEGAIAALRQTLQDVGDPVTVHVT